MFDFARHLYTYFTKSQREEVPADLLQKFDAAFAHAKASREDAPWKWSKKDQRHHRRTMQSKEGKAWAAKAREEMTESPLTGAPVDPDDLEGDHDHQTGDPKKFLPGRENRSAGCIIVIVNRCAMVEYDGNDPKKFMPIFRRHLLRILNLIATVLTRRRVEFEALWEAAEANDELAGLLNRREGGDVVDMTPLAVAMESGILVAAATSKGLFLWLGNLTKVRIDLASAVHAQKPDPALLRARLNTDRVANPRKGAWPDLKDLHGKYIYPDALGLAVGETKTDAPAFDDEEYESAENATEKVVEMISNL
jgi:hypothetical protein